MAHDRCNHDRGFLNCKRSADADARTDAERQIGKTVNRLACFAEESVRVESVWPRPQCAMTMQNIGRDNDQRTGLNRFTRKLVITQRCAADRCDWRIKPVGLVNHRARDDKTISQTLE